MPSASDPATLEEMGYPGSKGQAGVYQRIIGQMPPHGVYVEPFFGSGQVFWHKARAEHSIVIDKAAACIATAGATAGVSAIVGDAISELPRLGLGPDALVYCDPPYPLSTRGGRRYYEHEMSDLAHTSLLALLHELPCRVLISGYPCELYGRALQNWRCELYRTRTHGRTVTEALWANFPEPEILHDMRYAGRSFRERLTFKRLAARYLRRFERMPARKRAFVLAAVSQRYPERWLPAPLVSSGVDGR